MNRYVYQAMNQAMNHRQTMNHNTDRKGKDAKRRR